MARWLQLQLQQQQRQQGSLLLSSRNISAHIFRHRTGAFFSICSSIVLDDTNLIFEVEAGPIPAKCNAQGRGPNASESHCCDQMASFNGIIGNTFETIQTIYFNSFN